MGEITSTRSSVPRTSALFAWQGWRLNLPPQWNPVKLDGDYDNGFALIADMNRPQLGLRWRTIAGKRFHADRWAQRAMRDEVGRLAASEGKPAAMDAKCWEGGLLFLEPDPPGRDVFVGHSLVSRRVVEIVHHVQRRDRMLTDVILPQLLDSPPDQLTPWSVFNLSCVVPTGFRLTAHRLNAGDLTLAFERRRESLTVRQIALAEMALRRLSLDKWLANQERAVQKRYKPSGERASASLDSLAGVRRTSTRRRRFGFMRWLPREVVTFALHDTARDRLLLLQGTDVATIEEVARTIGG